MLTGPAGRSRVAGNYSYAGEWRIDGCTTLTIDNGYCSDQDCPWRVEFEDEDVIELADKIHGNTQLTMLSAAANKITDEGVMAIAEALRDNEGMTDLNLSGNQITDNGGAALAEALAKNSYLTTLDLGFNNLTDVSARLLIALVKSDVSSLDRLGINNNDAISAEVMAECKDANEAAFRPPPTYQLENTDEAGNILPLDNDRTDMQKDEI